MPCRVAYVFQVIVLTTSPHTPLGGHSPDIFSLLLAGKHFFKLNHAGIGEKQRWVIMGNQSGAIHHSVAPIGKVL